jgi:hypothetical protein
VKLATQSGDAHARESFIAQKLGLIRESRVNVSPEMSRARKVERLFLVLFVHRAVAKRTV